MMQIKRFLSDVDIERIKRDFGFFIDYMTDNKDLKGEFYIALRENYFNIYYQGNSLAKVSPKEGNSYHIEINKAFLDKKMLDQFRDPKKETTSTVIYKLGSKDIHPFFQRSNLGCICQKIRERNFSEEISFEQALITDNQDRDDLIMIDRQISDKSFKNQKIDILALKKVNKGSNLNRYNFLVIEVKLGNNRELENKVASQLSGYVDHVVNYFNDYKECYEKQYKQKYELGLFPNLLFNKIEIVKPVEGLIVVGGYKHIATEKINKLKKSFTSLSVIQQDHFLEL